MLWESVGDHKEVKFCRTSAAIRMFRADHNKVKFCRTSAAIRMFRAPVVDHNEVKFCRNGRMGQPPNKRFLPASVAPCRPASIPPDTEKLWVSSTEYIRFA
jgi:hypothetical protein